MKYLKLSKNLRTTVSSYQRDWHHRILIQRMDQETLFKIPTAIIKGMGVMLRMYCCLPSSRLIQIKIQIQLHSSSKQIRGYVRIHFRGLRPGPTGDLPTMD